MTSVFLLRACGCCFPGPTPSPDARLGLAGCTSRPGGTPPRPAPKQGRSLLGPSGPASRALAEWKGLNRAPLRQRLRELPVSGSRATSARACAARSFLPAPPGRGRAHPGSAGCLILLRRHPYSAAAPAPAAAPALVGAAVLPPARPRAPAAPPRPAGGPAPRPRPPPPTTGRRGRGQSRTRHDQSSQCRAPARSHEARPAIGQGC